MASSYSTIKSALSQFASAHQTIKRFKCSFFESINGFAREDQSFPILYVIPNDVSLDSHVDIYSFRVYCVDQLLKDRTNEEYVLNETALVLRDLFTWMTLDTTIEINAVNKPILNPVNNFLGELTCGWYMDIDIEGAAQASDCAIPFSDNFQLTGITVDEVFIREPYLTCGTVTACTSVQDYVSLRISTATTTGAYLNLSGGTVTGGTTFSDSLTATTIYSNVYKSQSTPSTLINLNTDLDIQTNGWGAITTDGGNFNTGYLYVDKGSAYVSSAQGVFVSSTASTISLAPNSIIMDPDGIRINSTGPVSTTTSDSITFVSNGVTTFAVNPTGINVTGNISIGGDVEILGDLTVLNTQTVQVSDNLIVLNYSGTHLTSTYGGISVTSGQTSGAPSTLTVDSDGNWSANTSLTAANLVSNGTFYSSGDATFYGGVQFNQRVSFSAHTINASTTATTIDLSLGNVFLVNMSSNTTLDYSNASIGSYQFIFTQDSTGSRTLSFASNKFKASNGTTPILTTTSGSTDMISAIYDGTSMLIMDATNFTTI